MNKLCLLWQEAISRKWYHVANLVIDSTGTYLFSYEKNDKKRGLNEAIDLGYKPHPTFPDFNKKYQSDKMFSAFLRRLPDRNRNDYKEILKRLGINSDSSDFDLLSVTGGILNSDSYEFVKPIEFNQNEFSANFYLRGWRYYNAPEEALLKHDFLTLEIEEGNEYDEDAVCILKNENKCIGYVPAFYSSFVKDILTNDSSYEVNYEFNSKAPSQYKVNVTLNGTTTNLVKMKHIERVLLTV